jgi:beta-lactamase regulating signal transducer with metallopeptidase domain
MIAYVVQAGVALMSLLDVAIVVKATIVLAFGLAALPLARRARAAVRHLLMAATFGTVLVLPLLITAVPPVTIHVPFAVTGRVTSVFSTEASAPLQSANNTARSDSRNDSALPSVATLLRSAWAIGAIALLALLAIDLRRLRRLRRSALPWPAQNDLLRPLVVTSGVQRTVEVLLHEGISAPLTCGLWRPVILLPIDASDWHEADLRRALVHELEHVRRGDWATQLLARLVCACYWFHPLVWMAWGRLRLEAERACDDAVIECAECTEYAEQLVSLARRMSTSRALPTLAMANRTDLSARVTALLDGTRRRGRVGHATTAGVVGIACLTVLLVTSVRAIAAPTSLPQAAHIAQPARESLVAPQPTHQRVRAPATPRSQGARVNPKRSARQRASGPIADRTKVSRDSSASAQNKPPVISQSILGSAGAVGTLIHSSTASGTATHSASASSSSN